MAANYRASCLASSKAGFIAKSGIVIEEADEPIFWLEFIVEEDLLKSKLVEPLLREAKKLTEIFFSSRKTARKKETMDS